MLDRLRALLGGGQRQRGAFEHGRDDHLDDIMHSKFQLGLEAWAEEQRQGPLNAEANSRLLGAYSRNYSEAAPGLRGQ